MREIDKLNSYIRSEYKKVFGNQYKMSEKLGICRVTLWSRLYGHSNWTIYEMNELNKWFNGKLFDKLNSI